MHLDSGRFDKLIEMVISMLEAGYRDSGAAVTADDATAILAIARLVVSADGREDGDELAVYAAVATHLGRLAGVDPVAGGAPGETLEVLAAPLRGRPVGELAYAIAFLVTVADVDLARDEEGLLDDLRLALGIDEERALDLATVVGELVTPSE